MSDDANRTHYFAEQPDVPSDPQTIEVQVRGRRLSFVTDRGVFSHGKVDAGSRLLAEQMDLSDAADMLDWGCAWGLIGIVAKKKWPGLDVVMVDINERACELARRNLRRNDVEAEVIAGDAAEMLADREFDAVVCNPPISAGRAAVLGVMDHAARVLRDGGSFWMVAATKKGAKTLRRKLEERFADVELTAKRGGFRVYRASDPIMREDDGE
ncbi:MAG: class I SAM-dependent methyltransferase [Armatimonadota bacterium]